MTGTKRFRMASFSQSGVRGPTGPEIGLPATTETCHRGFMTVDPSAHFFGRRLDDETAYVTGASSGIGASIARQLVARGARVFLGARRTDRLEQVAAALRNDIGGARVDVARVDVNDDASVDAWLAAGARVAPCSILVNNAGLALGKQRVEEADVAL